MNSDAHSLICAKAPTRIDIAGGTLDLWPLSQFIETKATVNIAIGLHAEVSCRLREDQLFKIESVDQKIVFQGDWHEVAAFPGLPLVSAFVKALWRPDGRGMNIKLSGRSPAGAGLGGSSSLSICLAACLAHSRAREFGHEVPSERELVAIAGDVEAKLIWAPTGVQDYWGAVRGGINVISYPAGGPVVDTFSADRLDGLKNKIILCYSGHSRASAQNNWTIYKGVIDRDKALLELLTSLGVESQLCAHAVRQGDWDAAMAASGREWQIRCRLARDIEIPETRKMADAALAAGAKLARLCGAGGGGVMAVYIPQTDDVHLVKKALEDCGGTLLDAELGVSGLMVSQEEF